MDFTGVCIQFGEEECVPITDAKLVGKRLSISWTDPFGDWLLVATSPDGVVFNGTYGEGELDPMRWCQFKKFKCGKELVFLGDWKNLQQGTHPYPWLFRLEPVKPSRAKRPAS